MEYPNPNSPAARTARLNALREARDQTQDIVIAAREARNQIRLRLERVGYHLGHGRAFHGVITPEMRVMITNAAVQRQRYRQNKAALTRQNEALEKAEENEAYLAAEEKIEEERQRFGREEEMRMRLWKKVTKKSWAQRKEERVAKRIVELEAEIGRKQVKFRERVVRDIAEREAEIAESLERERKKGKRVERGGEEREGIEKEMEEEEKEMEEMMARRMREEAGMMAGDMMEREESLVEKMTRMEEWDAERVAEVAQAGREIKKAKKAAEGKERQED
ncbi:uncharacterized protein LAJ45_03706 [Morchella importuna]|uniref:uncharacterized protein n=1 Tax=Morchella importuna TaxID=1174673 RepID=UPI001E8E4BC3|nr:uncharacterized protein LAJ45_03706 [Morchella importuna]KAH8152279.1 hypothetical protein LAJ45_03706 [Morchella importuna]